MEKSSAVRPRDDQQSTNDDSGVETAARSLIQRLPGLRHTMKDRNIPEYWYKIRVAAKNSGNPRVPYRILNLQGSCMLHYPCRLTAFVVALLPLTCAGQGWFSHTSLQKAVPNQGASQNRYKVTGTVINSVTGEPIVRAAVRTNGPAPSQQVFTDGSGHFEMSDVPEGQILVSAQRPRFLGSDVIHHRLQTVMVGPATPPVQIKLTPESVIKGKVTNGEGEPIEGISVQAMSPQINNGHKIWGLRGSAQTDENGEYEMENLPPDQYILSTSIYLLSPAAAVAENGPINDTYPPQYFPNAPEQDSAQPINVQAGQTTEADFRLSSVRSYSVTGVVSGPEYTNVSCQDASGNQRGWGQSDGRTGKFKLLHVLPGACFLTFQGQGGQGVDSKTYFAEQEITIGASDIAGLRISMQPLSDIPVHFPDSVGGVPVQLQLMPRQKRREFQQFYLSNQPGSQTPIFQSVPPGSYKLIVQSSGNACVSSVFQGGADLLHDDLTVAGGSSRTEPIEVTLRNDCAALSGTVKANSPGSTGMILVAPSAPNMEPKVAPAFNGNFTVPGLAPGDYTVYAFSDISGLEYANPEALREFSGQKITLGPSAKATMQLDLITRGEAQ